MKLCKKLLVIAAGAMSATLIAGVVWAGSGGGHGPHWGYEGHGGPSHWGDLAPEFAACKAGHKQPPIDIARAKHGD